MGKWFFSSFTPTLTPSASLCSSLGGTQWRNTSTTAGSWRWWGRWVKIELYGIFVRHCPCLCIKSPCMNHVNVGHKGPDCVPQHHLQGEGKLSLSQRSMVEKYRFTTSCRSAARPVSSTRQDVARIPDRAHVAISQNANLVLVVVVVVDRPSASPRTGFARNWGSTSASRSKSGKGKRDRYSLFQWQLRTQRTVIRASWPLMRRAYVNPPRICKASAASVIYVVIENAEFF